LLGGQTGKEDAMFKTTFTAIALVATVVTTTGCGLSYDYQRNSLLGAGPSSLCYAATDPRIGGFAVRAQAAQDLVDQRGIQCDYGVEAQLHAGQAEAQQLGIAAALATSSALQQQAQPHTLGPAPSPFVNCWQAGVFWTCQ
jgi:hypothetical protein